METFGVGKAASPMAAAATVPARTCGTMPKPFRICIPKLERTLRELELGRSMDESGHVTFRSALPEGPVKHDFHAASDGQLGGIMKVFRDWQISGDTDWLKKMYPLAKRSLDYCIRTWDPDHRGGLFEPHHNTYDIEFWGPDGMCTSIYLGALSAIRGNGAGNGPTGGREVLRGPGPTLRALHGRAALQWRVLPAEGAVHGFAGRRRSHAWWRKVDEHSSEMQTAAEAGRPEIPIWKRLHLGWSDRSVDGPDLRNRHAAGS